MNLIVDLSWPFWLAGAGIGLLIGGNHAATADA